MIMCTIKNGRVINLAFEVDLFTDKVTPKRRNYNGCNRLHYRIYGY